MSCMNMLHNVSHVSHKCLQKLGLQPKSSKRKILEISAPFDFKEGPAVNFPGFAESDISLMKEKAIASTAVSLQDEGLFNISSTASAIVVGRRRSGSGYPLSQHRHNHRHHQRSGSNVSIRKRVVDHARKVSMGRFY